MAKTLAKFMQRSTQEVSARRISPSNFDTVLPPEARAELVPPKRPRILKRPAKAPVPYARIILMGFVLMIITLGAIAAFLHPPARASLPQAPRPVPTVAAPTPAPRAIRVPAAGEIWRIHWSQNWSFPVKVLGRLASTAQLPIEGRPGDAYVIGDHIWFYGQPPGIAYPCWVDP